MPDFLARELLLPPAVRANVEREELIDRQLGKAQALDRALRQYDPKLSLVWVKEGAPESDLVPGRWHVCRQNDPPAPHTYMPITTEDGGYREPDFGVLNELAKRDLWKVGDPVPAKQPEKPLISADDLDEELASSYYAARRVPGENVHKRRKHRG